jgi:hypothetical protein
MTFSRAKQLLNIAMLPHSVVGHPLASLASQAKFYVLARRLHYWTLPRRVRKRVDFLDLDFCPDSRLYSIDRFWIPLCSLLVACAQYRLVSWVWVSFAPHETAQRLGACSYYMSDEERHKRAKETQIRRSKFFSELVKIEAELGEKGYIHSDDENWGFTSSKYGGYYNWPSEDKEQIKRWSDIVQELDLVASAKYYEVVMELAKLKHDRGA